MSSSVSGYSNSSDPLVPRAASVTLIVIAVLIVVVVLIWQWVLLWARRTYRRMVSKNTVNLDESFLHDRPSARSCLKCVLLHKFNVGWSRQPNREGLELIAKPSDKVTGLKVTFKKKNQGPRGQDTTEEEENGEEEVKDASGATPPPLVIGTIR
jgi:hypothetical protein